MRIISKFIIAAAAALAAVPAHAALPILQRTNLDFIRDAVAPALRVVRTTYNIAAKEYTEIYATDNDSVFGRDFSLAVITPAGIVLSESAIFPWKNDSGFQPYSNDETLTPTVHDRTFSKLSSTAIYRPFVKDEFADFIPVGTNGNDDIIYSLDFDNSDKEDYINCIRPHETTRGLAIWITVPENLDLNKDTEAQIKIENATIEFDNTSSPAEIKKINTNGTILGGIFVVPVVVRPGLIEFKLAGIIAPPAGPGTSWRVIKLDLPAAEDETPAI